MLPRLLPREDVEVSELLARRFREEGIDVRAGHVARRIEPDGEGPHRLICEHEGREIALPFDEILVALGRRPRVEGFGLEALGVGIAADRAIEVNEYLQTACPNVFACGDVAGPFQFTHVASHQAWYATVNALFRSVWRFPVDYSAIPWATFTDPEVARVGINELEARERGIDFEITRYPLSDLDRAIADEAPEGWVEVLTAPGKDRILGATVVGRERGGSHHRVRERDAPSPGAQQDPRHDPHLSHPQRGEPLRRRGLAPRARARAPAAPGGTLPRMAPGALRGAAPSLPAGRRRDKARLAATGRLSL